MSTITLAVEDGSIFLFGELVFVGSPVITLSAENSQLALSSEAPAVALHPLVIVISDVGIALSVDSPSVTLGRLPKGLQFISNAGGTADIHGIPADGTEGDYQLPLTADNGQGTANQTLILKVRN